MNKSQVRHYGSYENDNLIFSADKTEDAAIIFDEAKGFGRPRPKDVF